MVYSMRSPIGEIRTTLAPMPTAISDPSKYSVQYSWQVGGGGICTWVHSAMKSVRTYDLIAVIRMYMMWQPMSLVAHLAMRPEAS